MALDDGKAPFFEWFVGGLTSAAFNEVDRHVLAGAGGEAAFVEVGGAALTAAAGGAPIAEHCRTLTRKELLIQSALAAQMLREAGLGQGDRVVFLLWTAKGSARYGAQLFVRICHRYADLALSP